MLREALYWSEESFVGLMMPSPPIAEQVVPLVRESLSEL